MSIVNDEARDDNLSEHEGLEAPSKTPSKNLVLNVKAAEIPSEQREMVFALVEGEALTEVPKDLYIPPDALEIFLEKFEGPLDLLLYLIKRENLDILEINIADITDQYMAYVELMESSQFELAAEYLVMAAMLAEIKSKILLPRDEEEVEEEGKGAEGPSSAFVATTTGAWAARNQRRPVACLDQDVVKVASEALLARMAAHL